jgi:polyvinyl alcohol dehydrogenase (cytochrome)
VAIWLGPLLAFSLLACGSSKSSGTASGMEAGTGTGTDGNFPSPGNLDCNAASTDWPMFGQNICNTASQSNAGGISVGTAPTLGPKWVVDFSTAVSGGGDISATPIVVGGYVYVADWGGNITKLDANTGSVTWSKSVGDILTSAGDAGSKLPGFASRNAPVITNGMVIFGTLRGTALATNPGNSAFLVAIDQNTGALKWSSLLDDHQAAIIAGSPVVDGTTAYIGVSSQEEYSNLVSLLNPGAKYTCCSFRGSVVAVDVMTGAIKWKTHTIADSLYYANDAGKLSGWAGVAVWSSTPVIDRKRHQIYVTTGNNYANVPKEAEAGADEGNYVDSIMALDMETGHINWARSFPKGGEDLWSMSNSAGPDSDFGAGANLFTAMVQGKAVDVVGAGQKSGMYWALNADTGETVWHQQVGPGGHLGGIHWGTATDGTLIYMENNIESSTPFVLGGRGPNAGTMAATGIWSAIDVNTGDIVWQLPNPAAPMPVQGASCNGPVAVTNGVLFAGSMDMAGAMFALNASTGDVLWKWNAGGTVYGGPAIANGVVYWGCGYPNGFGTKSRPLGFGTPCHKLYAFAPGLGDAGAPAGDSGTGMVDAGPGDAGAADSGAPTDASGQ